jgi:SAM-dependent methyltransferase
VSGHLSDRKQKLLSGLDLPVLVGIEVGALDRPLVTPEEGRIIYVDHVDTAGLREKYARDPTVDKANLVEVEAVWAERTLVEAVGGRVDYVVASHVIEHVPDLITWLSEIRDALVPGGRLRLAVPDRRYTFDYRRSDSRLADVVHAWLMRARRPLPQHILDHILEAAVVDTCRAWQGHLEPKPISTLGAAVAAATDARDNAGYHDVHCWVFTSVSFIGLMGRLSEIGLLGFSCAAVFAAEPYTNEFIVHLDRCDDPVLTAANWGPIPALPERDADIQTLCRELAELRSELAAIRTSRAWKTTAVLREIIERLHRLLKRH